MVMISAALLFLIGHWQFGTVLAPEVITSFGFLSMEGPHVAYAGQT